MEMVPESKWRDETPMKFFFINVRCGATTAWLRQFSRRVTFQYTSFESEAKIHLLDAISRGVADIVPQNARMQLLRLWMLWRLVALSKLRNNMFKVLLVAKRVSLFYLVFSC